MQNKWDVGDDERDQDAREAGENPCDLEGWRRPTWGFLGPIDEFQDPDPDLRVRTIYAPVGRA